jgi:ABC-type uncharacterized transport system ATPase subunit
MTASELIAQVTKKYDITDLTIEDPEIAAIVADIYEDGMK